LDEDGDVAVVGDYPPSENSRRAVETLIFPFGADAWFVKSFLREWRRSEAEFGFEYSLSTPGAAAVRLDRDTVEIEDMYGQFESTRFEETDFLNMLESLISYLESLEAGD
jgi:hypothetical protein